MSTWQTRCGIADYTGHLVDALRQCGVQTEIAAIDRSATDYLSRRELRDYFDALAQRATESDLVHIQHEFSFFGGAYSWGTSLGNLRRFLRRMRAAGTPTVATFHTDPLWFVRRNDLILDQALQAGARAFWRTVMPSHFAKRGKAVVIAHSRTTRRHLIDAGISPEAIEVIAQGIPRSSAGEASPEERAGARAWLGLPREAIVLGMFGFVAAYKGYATALDALRRLPEQYHLLVVGGRHPLNRTPDLDPVLDALDDDELAGRLTFTGFVSPEERNACLTATDICLAPYTGYPLVSSSAAITWALASGRPTIASDIPAFRELWEDEDCLELVAPESSAELALAVETLSRDRQRQQELTSAAQRLAEASSWPRVAEHHVAVYRRLLEGTARSRGSVTGAEASTVAAAAGSENGRPAMPPTPLGILRRPTFARMELDGAQHSFWLAHDKDPRDLVTASVLQHDFAGTAQWQLIRHIVESAPHSCPPVVVDLGAHVGTISLPLAALGVRVLAVDASPRNVLLLRAAAGRNRFDRLEVIHSAVGERDGAVRFRDAGPFGYTLSAGAEDGGPTLEVPRTSLDALLARRGWPEITLVKIDIEGSELLALRGMPGLLAAQMAPAILLEHNQDALASHGSTFADVGQELVRHGYELLAVDGFEPGRLVPMALNDDMPSNLFDVLAIKDRADIRPPWRITPYSKLDLGGRLALHAKSPESVQRVHAGRIIAQAPSEIQRLPAVQRARAALTADSEVGVRAVLRTSPAGYGDAPGSKSTGGVHRNGRLSFRHGGRPTFGLATYANGHGGYGYSAEELMLAATAQGADLVWTAVGDSDDGRFSAAARALEAPEQIREREVLVIYCGAFDWPSLHAPVTLGMTMWETTELPDTWIPCCEGNRGLIVPSEFCREVFSEKVNVPIEVVPLGVNPERFPELERDHVDEFTFLMVGTLSGRKGPDIALQAFESEFEPHEPVRMVFKTVNGVAAWGPRTKRPTHPGVKVIDADLERHELLELYRSADCLVACSRGEASGLTPREAMSTGIPAIVTRWGGMLEIANPDCTFVLDVEGEEPAFGPIYPLRASGGARMGRMATPSLEHLRVLMRTAYENPQSTREMGRKAARWIRAEWTYERCARQWLESITRLVDLAYQNGNGATQ